MTDPGAQLDRKLRRNRASLLSDRELALMEAEARRIMGPGYAVLFADKGTSFRNTLRWSSLGAKCRQIRGRLRLNVRDVAGATGIPQYRVRAIEQGMLAQIEPGLTTHYFRFLGIESWVRRWARVNPELALHVGVILRPKRPRRAERGRAI